MRLIILLVIIALIAATITQLLFYYFKYVYKVKETAAYALKLNVDNYVGFNLDPGEINFGTVTPGGAGHREVYLKADEPTKVEVILEGELAKWVSVSENNFVFVGNKTLSFVAVSPPNAKFGSYTGKAILIFRTP